MLMYAIAHGHCVGIVRESALKVDSGRKVPCGIREWNWLEDCTWLFDLALYQLSWGVRRKKAGKKIPELVEVPLGVVGGWGVQM